MLDSGNFPGNMRSRGTVLNSFMELPAQRVVGLQPTTKSLVTIRQHVDLPYQHGLRKTQARKGVGVDGFNTYLLAKAPEEVQRAYWEALKGCIRSRQWPEEWKERGWR